MPGQEVQARLSRRRLTPTVTLLARRFVCDLLGFDEDIYEFPSSRLTAKWYPEPSVHGGKARPKDAKLVS